MAIRAADAAFVIGKIASMSNGRCMASSEHSRSDATQFGRAGDQFKLFDRRSVPACENPLQCPPMHIEPARGLRHVAPAGLMNLLDMLQAHIGWRHGILWRRSIPAQWRLQRGDNVIRIHRFGIC